MKPGSVFNTLNGTQMTQIKQMNTDFLLIFNLFICAHLRAIV
jgi:hypothetical protein